MVCVVEQPKDLLALEAAGPYRGVYHVLLGRIAPLEGIDPDDLTIGPLLDRLAAGAVREVIMGTNPNLEGDGTALHIQHLIGTRAPQVAVTRLARGLPPAATSSTPTATSWPTRSRAGRRCDWAPVRSVRSIPPGCSLQQVLPAQADGPVGEMRTDEARPV